MYLQNKQENDGGVPFASPMLKLDLEIWREKESVFFNQECFTFYGVTPFSLWRRAVVRFSWEVDDFLTKRKGKVALCLRVMTRSSLYIVKVPFR